MDSFGTFVRSLRERMDISVRELARRMDASAAFVSDIELGRRYPSDDVLARLAEELKTSTVELKSHDHRPPVEEMKRLTDLDPAFGMAFRTLLNKEVTAEDLLKLAENRPDRSQS